MSGHTFGTHRCSTSSTTYLPRDDVTATGLTKAHVRVVAGVILHILRQRSLFGRPQYSLAPRHRGRWLRYIPAAYSHLRLERRLRSPSKDQRPIRSRGRCTGLFSLVRVALPLNCTKALSSSRRSHILSHQVWPFHSSETARAHSQPLPAEPRCRNKARAAHLLGSSLLVRLLPSLFPPQVFGPTLRL